MEWNLSFVLLKWEWKQIKKRDGMESMPRAAQENLWFSIMRGLRAALIERKDTPRGQPNSNWLLGSQLHPQSMELVLLPPWLAAGGWRPWCGLHGSSAAVRFLFLSINSTLFHWLKKRGPLSASATAPFHSFSQLFSLFSLWLTGCARLLCWLVAVRLLPPLTHQQTQLNNSRRKKRPAHALRAKKEKTNWAAVPHSSLLHSSTNHKSKIYDLMKNEWRSIKYCYNIFLIPSINQWKSMIAEWNKKESYFSFLLNEGRIDLNWLPAALGVPPSFHLSSLFASPHPSPREDKWEEERKANSSFHSIDWIPFAFSSLLPSMKESVGVVCVCGRSLSLCGALAGGPAHNPQRKRPTTHHSASPPQEQQPNQSHSIKNKSFVFYWWIDGWTVPLGAMAAAKQIHLFFPLGREEKNEFCCCWWPAVQPSSSIIKQINFTLLNCFIV